MRNPIREARHVIATNYVGVASYTFLIYDHLLTLSDELDYIWRGRKGPVIYLFFLNRYFFPFAFIINLYAYLSPSFDPKMCKHFVRYEGANVLLGFGLTGLMMILRVNALYGGNYRSVQAILGTLWIAQISVYSWLLSTGNPVPHSPGIHGCSLVYDPSKRRLASLSAAVSIVFDTLVLFLTLYKTSGVLRRSRMTNGASNILLKTLMKDGIIYYCVVISANITLTIMLATASPDISNILSQFAQLLTVTMVSRITLHLRKTGAKRSSLVVMSDPHPIPSASRRDDAGGGGEIMAGSIPDNSEETLAAPAFTTAGRSGPDLTSCNTREGCLNVAIGSIVIAEDPRDDEQPTDELRRAR